MIHEVLYLTNGKIFAVVLENDDEFQALEQSGIRIRWHNIPQERDALSIVRITFQGENTYCFAFQNIPTGKHCLLASEMRLRKIMVAEKRRLRGEPTIFLDIDGVLNTSTEMFAARCVENLWKLVAWTGAKIVISSSWRMYGEDYLREIWNVWNLPNNIIGVTPFVNLPPDCLARGHEIKEWIESHKVKNYVIIDDDNGMLPEQQAHLVLTDGCYGLLEKDVFKAINIMSKTEIYKEKAWKSRARIHQSEFREKVLGCDCAPNTSRDGVKHFYGNILEAKAARNGMNFVECYREIIRQDICKRGDCKGNAFPNIPLTNNMLRSEHIAYNLFFPMKQNLAKLADLLKEIATLEIREVTDLKLEYPVFPRDIPNPWTGDHTAFDVYIQYVDNNGETCGIGIEIKYTEEGYAIGDGEKERLCDLTSDYHGVTMVSGCFAGCETLETTHERMNDKGGIRSDRFRQMWRNHILGLGMMQKEVEGYPRLHSFLSLHLYPAWNEHFAGEKGAVRGYLDLLTESGRKTFCAVTYEKLFKVMKTIVFDPAHDAEWKEYLDVRYLI